MSGNTGKDQTTHLSKTIRTTTPPSALQCLRLLLPQLRAHKALPASQLSMITVQNPVDQDMTQSRLDVIMKVGKQLPRAGNEVLPAPQRSGATTIPPKPAMTQSPTTGHRGGTIAFAVT